MHKGEMPEIGTAPGSDVGETFCVFIFGLPAFLMLNAHIWPFMDELESTHNFNLGLLSYL